MDLGNIGLWLSTILRETPLLQSTLQPQSILQTGLKPVSGNFSVKGLGTLLSSPEPLSALRKCPQHPTLTQSTPPNTIAVCSEQFPLPASWLIYPGALPDLTFWVQQEKGHNFPHLAPCPRASTQWAQCRCLSSRCPCPLLVTGHFIFCLTIFHRGKSPRTCPPLPFSAHGVGDTAVKAQPAKSLQGLCAECG